jgi:hypothetical protein
MKSLKILSAIVATILLSAFVAPAVSLAGIDTSVSDIACVLLIGQTAIAMLAGSSSMIGASLFATITTTQLATELKQYFVINPGVAKSWVYAMDVQLNKYARKITAVKGKYHAPHAVMSHVVQGFAAVWNEMGSTKLKSNELVNYRQKVNFPIMPDEIEGTYLAWANEENTDRKDRSISKFISDMLQQKVVDDVDDLSINGVYDANNLDVYGASMNGIKKILEDGILATVNQTADNPMYLVPLDKFNETNMLEQVTKFEKAIPTRLRKFIKRVYIGTDRLQDYILDVEDTLGTIVTFTEGNKTKTRLNNWEIVGLDKLIGSNLIFATPDDNLLQLIDLFDKPEITKVEEFEYKVKIYMEWWLGYGFYFNQMVFVGHTGLESGYNDAATTSDYLPELSGSGA